MSATLLFGVGAITTPPSTPKNPAKTNLFSGNATIRRGAPKPLPRLTKSGRSRISRGQLSADGPARAGGGSVRGRKRPVWADRHSRTRSQFNRQICPGQRRRTREADLSTQQTGAQAPSRLPRPPCHQRRPQGARRTPRTRPQASERLMNRATSEIPTWIGYGSGRTSSPLPMARE